MPTQFIYPSDIYDRTANLLAVLGSYWTSTYGGREQVRDLVASRAQAEQQNRLQLMDLIASRSRFTLPIYARNNWFAWTIRQSQRNDASTSIPKYDAGVTYDTGYAYDVPRRARFYAFPAPERLADARVMMNRFVDPSLLWVNGIDFVIEDNAIILRTDPFTDPRVATQPVYEAGEIVDQEAILWLFRADFDWDTIYKQFGYVLGMRLRSSQGYRDLLNAVFDGLVGGMAKRQILAAFSALTGIPLVKEATEVVEDIWMDRAGRLVITDQHVYRFHPDAVVLVAIGDTVSAGDSLTDALQFFELNRGQVPEQLQALALGKGFLTNCFYGDLVFENRDVAISVVTDHPSGFTRVTWPLGGFPADVDKFFEELHANGVAEAEKPIDECYTGPVITHPGDGCDTVTTTNRLGTIAHFMDQRTNRVGEPGVANLPKKINPLRFLVENVLRNNAYIVKVKTTQAGPAGLGLHNVRFLHKIVPAHTAMIVVVEITAAPTAVAGAAFGESLSSFTGMGPITDTVTGGAVAEDVTARLLATNCH